MCPRDTWTMEKVTHGKMNNRVRGSFLSVEANKNKIRWEKKRKGTRKEKGKEKKKKKEIRKMKEKEERKEKRGGVRESERKKKRERHFPSQSPENRRLKCVSARDKVGPRDESYAWVPETMGFVAFQKVGVSPTPAISCLVAM